MSPRIGIRTGWTLLIVVVTLARVSALPLDRDSRFPHLPSLEVELLAPVQKPIGTVLFLHGYRASAREFRPLFDWFVTRGWRVAALDLPGHGRSGGPRGEIEDFSEYGDAVEAWLTWVALQSWSGPQILVAHSMGAAAALDAFSRPEVVIPDRVVFCAPLLRTDWYSALALGTALTEGWLPTVSPARWGAQTRWFAALTRWLDRWERRTDPLTLPLTVYSGDADQVVDENWNRTELERRIPGIRWVTLEGKGHWFLEHSRDRRAFLVLLEADLGFDQF